MAASGAGRAAGRAGLRPGGYLAVDPGAYAGVPPVPVADVVAAAGTLALLLIVLVAWPWPVALLLACGAAVLFRRRGPWPWRRLEAPFVVDRPGVYVAGAPGEGRLVHWESIAAVVLCDVTSRRTGHRRLGPGLGLRLRPHPDVVAIRVPLDGRRVDERRLLAAVARFAPAAVSVVREGPFGDAFTPREVAADVTRRAAEGVLGYAAARLGPRSPAPLPTGDGRAGEEPFAVRREGVYLGPVHRRGGRVPGRLVPWADVVAVVVFDAQRGTDWHRAVGVAGARGLAPRELLGYRVADGWSFDRVGLEAAVRRRAPKVPVVDGPPLRHAGPRDLAAAAGVAYRARRNHRRRPDVRDETA